MDSVTIFWTRPPSAFLPPHQAISFVTMFFFVPFLALAPQSMQVTD